MVTVISNKILPNDKIVHVAFGELKGMGRMRGYNISYIWGFSKKVKMSYISDWYAKALSLLPSKYYLLEEKLVNWDIQNLKIFLPLKTYKFYRYCFSLPLRGQRTKTNAKTTKKFRQKQLTQDKIEMKGDVVQGLSKSAMKKLRKKTLRKERKKEEKKQQKYLERKSKLMV